MLRQCYMAEITLTESYQKLAAGRTVLTCDISALPANAGNALFKCNTGEDVPWIAGEFHHFEAVDISEIEVKGEIGDKITVIGYGA